MQYKVIWSIMVQFYLTYALKIKKIFLNFILVDKNLHNHKFGVKSNAVKTWVDLNFMLLQPN